MNKSQKENQGSVELTEDIKTNKIPLYNVILHNDNYTPLKFVVNLIVEVFNKSQLEAIDLTMKVHNDGKAIVAQYVKEIAETKRLDVSRIALKNEHPLVCTIEEVPNSSPSSSRKNKM